MKTILKVNVEKNQRKLPNPGGWIWSPMSEAKLLGFMFLLGLIYYCGWALFFHRATMIVEIEDWRTLRLNGMDMGLPFENSEIKVIVYCGSMQLQSRDGLVITLNKDGQVSTTPPGTEESCPHHIPPAWNHGKDFNDGRCKRPTDCVENPTCRDHPKAS